MPGKILVLTAVFVCGTRGAHAGTLRMGPVRAPVSRLAFATIAALSATPGTISFSAANPNSGTVSGSSSGTVTWTVLLGSHLQHWTVGVQAGSATFVGCSSIPVSAVQVSCSSGSVSGGGGTAACSGSFPLSTTLQTIAGGFEGDLVNSYSVSLNFTLAESWRYVAGSSCSITLTYSVNAP